MQSENINGESDLKKVRTMQSSDVKKISKISLIDDLVIIFMPAFKAGF